MVSQKLNRNSQFFLEMRWFWIALLTLAVLGVLNFIPDTVHEYYRLGIFSILRRIFDSITDILPFSFGWFFVIAIIANTFKAIKQNKIQKITWWLNSAGNYFVVFYLFWGFNYKALEAKDLLSIEPQRIHLDEYSIISLIDELNSSLDTASFVIFKEAPSAKDLNSVKQDLIEFLNAHSLSLTGNPKVILMGGNVLNTIGISGIYWPYSFEAYIEKSLLPAQLYFTATHELCHAYGFTSEAEANFIACAALHESENKEHRTIAQFEVLRELLSRLRDLNFNLYEKKWDNLNPAIIEEFQNRKIQLKKHQNWFWNVSTFSNDQFLKFQGQESGNKSYSEFLEYYVSWKNQSTPL